MGDAILETHDLHKHFGAIHAVNGLSLSIGRGEIYGLVGPNGSGKTTLMRLVVGLLRPSAGSIKLLGRAMPDKAVLARVGYMTQASALYEELSVRENITFFAEMCGSRDPVWVDEVITLVDLRDRARSPVRTLSGGLKQRTSLACSLAHRPQILLLDEPTVGVDPQLRVTFWEYFHRLAATGVTLVVCSHVMEEAERCDRLGFLRQGRLLAEGPADEIRRQANAGTLEEAFLWFAAGNAQGEQP